MDNWQHRHDISDSAWALLEPHLPGQKGQWGGVAFDNRRFINAVFWILRIGAPWRDLPASYGKWGTVHQCFRRCGTRVSGKRCLRSLLMTRIVSGL